MRSSKKTFPPNGYRPSISIATARLLILDMVQNSPDAQHESFVFDGVDVGGGADEDFIVTRERRPKRTTLELKIGAEKA
jgi:hypothetical protein